MSLHWPHKDKDEFLDFSLDWSRALNTAEDIVGVSWYIVDSNGDKVPFSNGTIVDSLRTYTQTFTKTVATIYLSGGIDNREYKLYCSITTSANIIKERSVKLRIREYN